FSHRVPLVARESWTCGYAAPVCPEPGLGSSHITPMKYVVPCVMLIWFEPEKVKFRTRPSPVPSVISSDTASRVPGWPPLFEYTHMRAFVVTSCCGQPSGSRIQSRE